MYFLDTGLCTHLTKWTSPETLEAGAMGGAIFETWVVSEIYKSYLNQGKQPPLYFYRDSNKKEMELHIEKQISEQAALYVYHLIYCLWTKRIGISLHGSFEYKEAMEKPLPQNHLCCILLCQCIHKFLNCCKRFIWKLVITIFLCSKTFYSVNAVLHCIL